jgi:tripartite-type tricarboxylate transporter receptor subunit TctC
MKGKWIIFLITSLFSFSFPAWAQQEFPTKPINFILVYTPGGTSDTSSKAIIEALKKDLKVPIIPKYVVGAGGSLGAYELTKSRADGYTIGNTTGVSMAFVPHITKVKYNPMKDFEFIGTYAQATVGMIVSVNSPFKSLKDLIEAARKNPGQIRFANTAPGGWMGLAPTYLEKVEKIRFKVVPFIGGDPEGMSALLGGHVDFMCANPAAIKPCPYAGLLFLRTPQRYDGSHPQGDGIRL